MGQCAICRRQDVPYSIEHVIPEALGGYYVRNDLVCVDCNSQLGRRVDDALVNHWLTQLYRFVYGVHGKAKSGPNPFAGSFTLQSDPGKKMQIRIGKDGRLIPYFVPEVKRMDLDGNRVQVNISVDAADEAQIDTIVTKIAERMGVSAEEVLSSAERTRVSSDGGLRRHRTVNMRDFKIGLLKIAYEFAADRVPGYLESDDAIHTAEVLREARFDDVERYVNIGDGLDQRVLARFSDFLGFTEFKHYLVLCTTDSGLLCFVHLHNLFSVGVTLSTGSFGDLLEFGVNDIRQRSFEVWRLEDIPVTTTYRPMLHFATEQEMAAFREAERAPDFDYEASDGSWKLFERDGTHLGLNFDDLVGRLRPTRSVMDAGRLVDECWLPEGIYLRPRGSIDQVHMVDFRAEHSWDKLSGWRGRAVTRPRCRIRPAPAPPRETARSTRVAAPTPSLPQTMSKQVQRATVDPHRTPRPRRSAT